MVWPKSTLAQPKALKPLNTPTEPAFRAFIWSRLDCCIRAAAEVRKYDTRGSGRNRGYSMDRSGCRCHLSATIVILLLYRWVDCDASHITRNGQLLTHSVTPMWQTDTQILRIKHLQTWHTDCIYLSELDRGAVSLTPPGSSTT